MNEINSKSNKDTLLYLYILGNIGNEKNYISSLVPYRINDEELFYGPCKKYMREEIKSLWEQKKNDINKMPKIYLVGINPAKNGKESQTNMSAKLEPRKILFAGEILKIFTFKEAWEHYKQIIKESLNEDYKKEVEIMRTGRKGKSPLLFEPDLDDNGREGYKHRTDMHKNEWLRDLLSEKERKLFEKTNDNKYPKEIYKKEKISFKRDCCFKLTNIHFSLENNQCPIELTDEMFELIKQAVLNWRLEIQKNNLLSPDITSPFGYNKLGHKYGRWHITLRNIEAEKFIQLLIENK